MNSRVKYTIALLSFLGGNIFAQDVHFSQMEFSPLTLNPGLAGANSGFKVSGENSIWEKWNFHH